MEQGGIYLDRCLTVTQPQALEQVRDRVILGDTFSVLPLLPESCADLLIVDPPYNLSKDFHGSAFSAMSNEDYAAYTEQWISAVKPLLKPNASIYVCCDWQSSPVVGLALQKHFAVRNRITWQREKGRGAKRNWKNNMEDIWFATCGEDYTFHVEDVMQRRRVIAPYRVDGAPKDWEETALGSFRNTHPSNFWDDVSVPYWSMAENTPHPTQKPEKLLAKLILASSSEGDLVLDPFGGSGSAAVTAKKLGRHFLSVEQNPQYCVWAQVRLERAEKDQTIQGYTDGVFWERNTAMLQKKQRKG
jgi:site-specific DNA-methyltransferase (adenine-specific)